MIKALIFDFDGLIFDTETYEMESFEELYREHNLEFPRQEWLECIGTISTFDPYDKLLNQNLDLQREDLKNMFNKKYSRFIYGKQARDGVIDYLNVAHQMQLKIGLATSSSRAWIDRHLDVIKLDSSVFDVICTSDDVKKVKPDPELYKQCLLKLDVEAYETIAFEDSPNGSLAAIRAGIPSVIVPNSVTENLIFHEKVTMRLNSKKDMPLIEVIEHIHNLQKNRL